MTDQELKQDLRRALDLIGSILQRIEGKPQQKSLFSPEELSATEESVPFVKSAPVPYAQIVANYNLCCISLPKCSQLSEDRKKHIRARFLEANSPQDAFLTFFQRVEESDFLTGRSTANFRASFDWLMKPSNFVKVREGNYDNNGNSKNRTLTDADHKKGF